MPPKKVVTLCSVCNTAIGATANAISCSVCTKSHHPKCALIRDVQLQRMKPEDRATWTCVSCRGARGKAVTSKAAVSTPGTVPDSITIADLYYLMMEIKDTIRDVSESQQFLADQYEDLRAEHKLLKDMRTTIEAQDSTIKDLQARLVSNEQYSRRFHLELGNIDQSAAEDVEKIVIDVAKRVGVPIAGKDIAKAHRLKAGVGKTPSIIVEFANRKVRDKIFENRKVIPKEEKLFVNESLCPYYKKLLLLAKETCKQMNVKYCWFRNNKILVKKTDSCKTVAITEFDDLVEKIKAVARSQSRNVEGVDEGVASNADEPVHTPMHIQMPSPAPMHIQIPSPTPMHTPPITHISTETESIERVNGE